MKESLEAPRNQSGQGFTLLLVNWVIPTNQLKVPVTAELPTCKPARMAWPGCLTSQAGTRQALSLSPSPSGRPVLRVAIISFQIAKKGQILESPHWGLGGMPPHVKRARFPHQALRRCRDSETTCQGMKVFQRKLPMLASTHSTVFFHFLRLKKTKATDLLSS